MSGLTGFNVGYSNTFGGELSFLDISYILTPKTSGTNINTNFFYNKNPGSLSITYTDLSNVFLKSKTNNVIDISYQVIPVTKYYDPSLNTTPVTYYDIGQVFEPYYNDISFSSITSKQTGLIIYKYINGVKIVNNGYSNFTGIFVINPGQTGAKSVKFACVGGGGGSLGGGGGGGAGVIIGSVDMSYNHSYYFGVGNGNPGTGGNTYFRSSSASSNTTYNFISSGGGIGSTKGSGSTDLSGNGGVGGDASVSFAITGFNCTINYISTGGGGGGGYYSTTNYHGTGGVAGNLTVTGTSTIDISGNGQNGSNASSSSPNYGGNGGGNYNSSYTSFNSIPDQTTYYFGGGGGGSNTSNNGYPSTYPTNGWNSGGNGATSTINSSVIDSYQFGGGGGGSKTSSAVGGGGPGALMFSWNYP